MKRRLFHAAQAGSVVQQLSYGLNLSTSEASALVDAGAVYIEGRRAKSDAQLVPAGAKVMVVLEESGRSVEAPVEAAGPVTVLYEDDDVLAVNKPAGMVSQPSMGRVGNSVLDWATAYLGRPAGLVHRLDRETSGVMVFGKRSEGTTALAAAFREGRARKEYRAVVCSGLAASGTIDAPLSKDPSRPGRWRASHRANGIAALTNFSVLQGDGEWALVALFPQTGRTHQLRAHLTSIGFPIVGDSLYGGKPGPRCLLHALVLEVNGLTLRAPLPSDIEAFLQRK